MKNFTHFVFGVLLVTTLAVATSLAQEAISKPINGGVVNGKATSLPKPAYPPAARAVGASGAVSVQVLIDENGTVVSATAISGHPLLRAASVEAAKAATFSPTQLSGQPVKVAGVIVYNFVGPLYTARIGFVLSYADRMGRFGRFQSGQSLAEDLPSDWIDEKQILSSLTYEEGVKTPPRADDSKNYKSSDVSASDPKGEPITKYIKGSFSAVSVNQMLDSKSRASVGQVLKLAETRFSGDEASAWAFEVGRSLSILVADLESGGRCDSGVAEIDSLVNRAPSGIASYSLQQLKEFVEYARKAGLSAETKDEILTKAESLSTLRY